MTARASPAVIVLWAFFIALAIEIVTGVALFLGAGGTWARLHLNATWVCLAFPVLHVILHWTYGGTPQVLRIVHPSGLAVPPPPPDFAELLAEHLERGQAETPGPDLRSPSTQASQDQARPGWLTRFQAHPLVRAAAAAIVLAVVAAWIERTTRPTLVIAAIDRSNAPTIDGELSDPVWAKAPVAHVMTRHGANLGGAGESQVEIRAVHDGEFAYFAFIWSDPTRSLKHLPLVKRQDGWHLVQTAHDTADENWFYEDKFSVLVAPSGMAIIGAAIHFATAPLRNRPHSFSGRGLHFTSDGSIVDVWLWRAAHGGLMGRVENCHIGPPAAPSQTQLEGRERYAGGFAADPPSPTHYDNFETQAPGGYQGAVHIRRLPRDWQGAMAGLGRIDEDARHSESEGARWWMTEEESIPYSPAADRLMPQGSVIPGAVVASVDNAALNLRGQARWSAGRWSLEIVRRLDTGNKWDVPLKSGALMWVAVFDHTETRHTWHLRPLTLEVK